MKIHALEALGAALDVSAVIAAVRGSLIGHAEGSVRSPPPMHLLFEEGADLIGDCHVKAAQGNNCEHFVVKVASGFYRNAAAGLDSNSGMVLLCSSRTGRPEALFCDEGWLTAWRTAAAGALSVEIAKPSATEPLGILGTGAQARLQAEWISAHCGIARVVIWGRNADKAAALAADLTQAGFDASSAATPAELGRACRIIVTTTPAAHPILMHGDLGARAHIVAVGSDNAGKREVDGEILSRASTIVVDDPAQCLENGEFGAACRDGLVAADACTVLGEILARGNALSGDLNVVDLTGLGAQDLAVAALFHDTLI